MDKNEKMSWQEIPAGAVVIDAGNASACQTGDWRSNRPVFHPDKCINCLQCWIYCPDASIIVENGKVVGLDYYHCKGCGICSKECPVKGEKAITMIDESEAQESAGEIDCRSEVR